MTLSLFVCPYGKLQIPTRTGAVVHAFHLHVASPQAVILGGQVSHVDILTPSLTLVCIVDNVNNHTRLSIHTQTERHAILICPSLAENPTLPASSLPDELILGASSASPSSLRISVCTQRRKWGRIAMNEELDTKAC